MTDETYTMICRLKKPTSYHLPLRKASNPTWFQTITWPLHVQLLPTNEIAAAPGPRQQKFDNF